jgi:hypothetical protein
MSSLEAVRNAFAGDDFDRAHRLWNEYAAALEKSIAAGQGSRAMLAEASALVEWARLAVLSFHAHSSARLAAARVAEIYTHKHDPSACLVRTRL